MVASGVRAPVVGDTHCAPQTTETTETTETIETTERPSVDFMPKEPVTSVSSVTSLTQSKTLALFLAAFLFCSTVFDVDSALAARSGGRVGGSSFSSARMRSAPSPSSRATGGVRVNNYYAPPIVSPYGYGMGGGLIMPFPMGFGLGGLFNIMVLLFMVNVAVSVVSGFTNGGRRRDEDEDEDDERW